ncbi:hypothetical protein SAMN05443144_1264 [Fodinibius roseus]|uniref:Lipid/polyisoprenoid-binding YceI-like domain-containing protein n=1 Tax=Fodinibius roseus TaxID=1194090 RepID=A0A1M5J702_9BACT|nr:hypothetical protein SAMN05443144_1264 [Fodinibius roseus]
MSPTRSIVQSLAGRYLPRFPGIYPIVFVSLLAVIPFPAEAQISPQGAIEIEQGGKLWIEGSASIVDYRCQAERLSGNGTIENTGNPQENVKGHGAVTISVSIPVYSLECGRKAMNNDMYKALKAGEYPSISYKLLHAILVDSTTSSVDQLNNWMNIKTTGVLEIAGAQDTTQVYVKGKLLSDDRFRVKGRKQISMKTYDIKPPTALLGLIKASNELTVYFDVTVRLKSS